MSKVTKGTYKNKPDLSSLAACLPEKYQLQKMLGDRVGKQTWLAYDLETQELVVIKILSLGVDFDWQSFKLFKREAEILKTLSHPNIPQYLDYLEIDRNDDCQFALVQNYIEGTTLEEYLAGGKTFSPDEVKELAKAILEILIYLHSHQPPVIHRDIKPSNIILTDLDENKTRQIYLVDFDSVASLAATEGTSITVVGTYGYMPPEQFGGKVTPKSDLYSLGATLIYIITGKHPTELLQSDLRLRFREITNLESAFSNWLEWMTEPCIEKRMDSANLAKISLDNLEKFSLPNKNSTKISKPDISEISLINNQDYLEIVFPPKEITINLFSSLFTILCLGSNIYLYNLPNYVAWVQTDDWVAEHNSYVLVMIFCSVPMVISLAQDFLKAIKKVRLRIDSEKIYYVNDLFLEKVNPSFVIHRSDISELKFYNQLASTNSKEGSSRLYIEAGKKKIEIDKLTRLTEAELHWLAYELEKALLKEKWISKK